MLASGKTQYWLAVSAAGLLALLASWTPLATQIDNNATDWLFRGPPPPPPAPPTPLTHTSPPLLSYFLNSQAHITVVSHLRKEDNKDDI
jgi:hypothetical protein